MDGILLGPYDLEDLGQIPGTHGIFTLFVVMIYRRVHRFRPSVHRFFDVGDFIGPERWLRRGPFLFCEISGAKPTHPRTAATKLNPIRPWEDMAVAGIFHVFSRHQTPRSEKMTAAQNTT